MRTAPAAQLAAAGLRNQSSWVRVWIDDGNGTFQNFNALSGRNWVESAEWGESADADIGLATVRLIRDFELISLNPLMAGSKLAGTVALAREFYIETAVMGAEIEPAEADWQEIFRGDIDDLDAASDVMELQGRDLGGRLQDAQIETQKFYGAVAGTAMETVMQSILTDAKTNGWLTNTTTLYSPNGTGSPAFNPSDSPGALVTSYKLEKGSVLDALSRLAMSIGWAVRYRWHANTSAFQLQLYQPAREIAAQGTLTLTGQPTAAQTMVVNATTLTADGGGGNDFAIGADVAATRANIVAAINAGAEALNVHAFGYNDGTNELVTCEWRTPGTAGNAVVFTEALSNATADGSGTLGGTQTGSSPASVHTFRARDYEAITALKQSVQDVRNVSHVTFQQVKDDPSSRITVTRVDEASIAKHKRRRSCHITEGATSPIKTIAEANQLARFVITDLADSLADQSVPVRLFPWLDVGDVLTFAANGREYDSDQEFAVMSYRCGVRENHGFTEIQTRGKPSGGVARWVNIEGHFGVAPHTDEYSDQAPTGGATTPGIGTILFTYDDPETWDEPVWDWAFTEYHINLGSGSFTPTALTKQGQGKSTSYTFTGLVPGSDYSIRVVVVDDSGNRSTSSTYIAQATERVGPYHENADSQSFDQMLRNGDLNIYTKGDAVPPDFWNVTGSGIAWGSGDEVYFTTTAATGDRAVTMDVSITQTPVLYSDNIPINAGELVRVGALMSGDVAESATDVDLEVVWLNAAGGVIGSADTTAVTVPNGTFEERTSVGYEAPALTRACYVRIRGTYVSSAYTLTIDRVGLVRDYAIAYRVESTNRVAYFAASGVPVAVDFTDAAAEEIGVSYSSGVYTIEHPGTYQFGAGLTTYKTTAHQMDGKIEINKGSGYVVVASGTSSTYTGVQFQHMEIITQTIDMDAGDTVRFMAEPNVASVDIDAWYSYSENRFGGRQMVRATR